MAISEQSYGRGRPVYGNGSFAPTKGTTDPSGYVDRELNKPSDSRSGLAAAALSRLQGTAPPVVSPGVLPLGDIHTLTITPTGQLVPNNPAADGSPPAPTPTPQIPQQGLPQPGGNMSPLAQAALSRLMSNGQGASNV